MKKQKLFKRLICGIIIAVVASLFCLVWIIKAEYPLAYNTIILDASDEFGVEPSLIASVIRVESDYNALSVSSKGAMGLMQIMPQTAKMIAEKLEVVEFCNEMLFSAEVNIRFGTFYLKYLINKFDDYDKVLFAYNAGEGTLVELLNNKEGFTIGDITIKETKDYVIKVLKTKQNYERIYLRY